MCKSVVCSFAGYLRHRRGMCVEQISHTTELLQHDHGIISGREQCILNDISAAAVPVRHADTRLINSNFDTTVQLA
jgi:hypothetical protein